MNLTNSHVKEIADKIVLESFFRQNPGLHLYSIGDLDDFFWPYTKWFGIIDNARLRSVFLIYSGSKLPVLLALEDTDKLQSENLLKSIVPRLPDNFYCHLSPGLEQIILEHGFLLESHGKHFKMSLQKIDIPKNVLNFKVSCRRLSMCDLDIVKDLYAKAYPGNWFDNRMLETGKYFGAFDDALMVGIAGVHVYSQRYRIAALGNITTLQSYRGQGVAGKLTFELCKDLLEDGIDNIGLNVKSDNEAAIRCYQNIGFQIQTKFEEFMIKA